MLELREMVNQVGTEMDHLQKSFPSPNDQVRNNATTCNLVGEAIRIHAEAGVLFRKFHRGRRHIKNYKSRHIDAATRFIPLWLKVAVALALGSEYGWLEAIVVTVGEKMARTT